MLDQTRTSRPRTRRTGFTLVEILIVVVILGILAALVTPQLTSASKSARENTLKDELRYMRTQIVVYKAQHGDRVPGVGGTFEQQMTMPTNEEGTVNATKTGEYKYGPYLSAIPLNPINGKSGVKTIATSDLAAAVDDTTGWIYSTSTQQIAPNTPGNGSDGIAYVQY
jgi:general secretion pathway protein G